ncbi:MAG: hypothetical protein V8R70_03525 [Candidatus Gastranaerophilaceae bacterium]
MNNFENIDIVKKKFNWGAFFLTFIWGFYNKVYITLLIIPIFMVPFIGSILSLICSVWFGINGNKWALENKSFQSIDDFNKYQKKFIYIAFIFPICSIISTLSGIFGGLYTTRIFPLHINNLDLIIMPDLIVFNVFLLVCCFIYLLYDNQKKLVLVSISLIVFLIYSFNPILQVYSYRYLGGTKSDAICDFLADYYISHQNINLAIKYLEIKDKLFKVHRYENEVLSNLYIVSYDYDNAIKAGGKYKICALQDDWQCVLNETTNRINNPYSKIQFPGSEESFVDDYSAFLYRAIAYKNLGNIQAAKKDYDIVLKLKPVNEKDCINIYNSNGLSYKQSIENQRKLYNIKN